MFYPLNIRHQADIAVLGVTRWVAMETAGAMHPSLIKAHLKMAGSSQIAIAKTLGINNSTVARVIEGRDKSRRVAEEIARVTGIPLETLWPGKYPSTHDSH
jgi:lambda repressor-like predicted transcriptional regulator